MYERSIVFDTCSLPKELYSLTLHGIGLRFDQVAFIPEVLMAVQEIRKRYERWKAGVEACMARHRAAA